MISSSGIVSANGSNFQEQNKLGVSVPTNLPNYSIHANIGIVNQPSVVFEYDLKKNNQNPQNHLYASVGFSRLSFWRDEGTGFEFKVGGQLELIEMNLGLWVPTKFQSQYKTSYGCVLPAINFGIRTRALNGPVIFRMGLGYPEIVYLGLGARF